MVKMTNNVFDVCTQNLDLESNESKYSDLLDHDDLQYEPEWVDTDSSTENALDLSFQKFPGDEKKSRFFKIHKKNPYIY